MKNGRRVIGMRCRECATEYPVQATHVCEMCFGPLDAVYDQAALKKVVSRSRIESGPKSMEVNVDGVEVGSTAGPRRGSDCLGRHRMTEPVDETAHDRLLHGRQRHPCSPMSQHPEGVDVG